MKLPKIGKDAHAALDAGQLYELITHWEQKAAEAEKLAATIQQNPLLAGNCYGMSDGLKLAASELRKRIEALEHDEKS